MSTYIIGDIHGYLNILERLLRTIKFKSSDHLWLTGDLINGGPLSLETIRFVKSLGKQAICILGNHDLTLLACAYNNKLLTNIFNNETNKDKLNGINPVLEATDRQDLINWLQHRPLANFSKHFNLLLVHAGVHPTWDISKTLILANELELILKSNSTDLYNHLYGDQPDNWDDNLVSWDRIRCIINYLTRMRFCTTIGKLDFHSKGEALTSPADYLPWYTVPDRKTQNITIAFGHWAALAGNVNHPNIIALDTGCRWGKRLTAYCIENQKFFYVENNS